jgi:hypothetical protein
MTKLVSIVMLFVAVACTEARPCDDASYFVDGVCRPKADAGPSEAASGPTFGTPCTEQAQCTGVVNACLKRDTDPSGQCSFTGCDVTPGACPSGWSCCDLAAIQPGAPFGCVPAAIGASLQLRCGP